MKRRLKVCLRAARRANGRHLRSCGARGSARLRLHGEHDACQSGVDVLEASSAREKAGDALNPAIIGARCIRLSLRTLGLVFRLLLRLLLLRRLGSRHPASCVCRASACEASAAAIAFRSVARHRTARGIRGKSFRDPHSLGPPLSQVGLSRHGTRSEFDLPHLLCCVIDECGKVGRVAGGIAVDPGRRGSVLGRESTTPAIPCSDFVRLRGTSPSLRSPSTTLT